MRISTRQAFLSSVSNMQNSQSRLADLQNQISTGKKLNKPSDDPVAAAQVVKLNRELAQTEKYQDNIDVSQRRLELEETVLESLNDAAIRIRELTTQAGNGTLSDADRKGIATEIRGLVSYSAGLMNTQDAQGEYLFAGSKGFDRPYQQDGEGNYRYEGDDGQRLIQVAPELFVPSGDSGQYLFEAASDTVELNFLPATPSYISGLEIVDEDVYTDFSRGKGDLQIEVVLDPDSPTPSYQYQIKDSGGTLVEGPHALLDIANGETVEVQGLKFTVNQPAESAFVLEPEVSGVKGVSVVQPNVANALQTSVGDITITFDNTGAVNQYSLTDSEGNPIAIDGSSGPFDYESGQDLIVGGYRLELGSPNTDDSFTFGVPLSPISPVTKVQVTEINEYAAAANANAQLEIQFTSESTYDLVYATGTVSGLSFDTSDTLILAAPLGNSLGVTMTVDNPKAGDVVTLDLSGGVNTET
ncbi:flagellar hook-associated protein FlgL, partial [Pontibacterium sp.]|uniref:flagellar hook-associated protein FlgL n=1 Tax=Pontibacterium sp. TaxID=2036026 RepID=UPI0035691D45